MSETIGIVGHLLQQPVKRQDLAPVGIRGRLRLVVDGRDRCVQLVLANGAAWQRRREERDAGLYQVPVPAGAVLLGQRHELVVHHREHEFAHSFKGRFRQDPKRRLPSGFESTLVDLDAEPCGPFPKSKLIDVGVDLQLVPLPGHTPGQLGAILDTGDATLFLAADHLMSQAWFLEDLEAGRLGNVGIDSPKDYGETNERVRRYCVEVAPVLLPAHDPEAPARLAAMERLSLTVNRP